MKVFYGIGELPGFAGSVVTVGSFDGVHLGHKELLSTTAAEAARKGVESIAVTFSPHPRKVLKKDGRTWLLTTTDEKLSLISATGIGNTIVIPFDEDFSRIGPGQFIESFIRGRLGASTLVVGYDHRFGHNKTGGYESLSDDPHGLEVIRVGEKTGKGLKISSTSAREAINQARMSYAALVLGHNYFLKAIANTVGEYAIITLPDPDKLMPPDGRYPVIVHSGDNSQPRQGIITVDKGAFYLSPAPAANGSMAVTVEFL